MPCVYHTIHHALRDAIYLLSKRICKVGIVGDLSDMAESYKCTPIEATGQMFQLLQGMSDPFLGMWK